jgi:hypothetical protein
LKTQRAVSCEKTAFWSHLYIKTNILPTQARDKHRENSKKDAVFRTAGEGGASYAGVGGWDAGPGWLRVFGGALSYLEDLSCAATNGAAVFARQQLSNFISREPGPNGRCVHTPRQIKEQYHVKARGNVAVMLMSELVLLLLL